MFFVGVGGLIFVPIFKTLTHLPPFVGVLLVLGVLWTVTEIFYRNLSRTYETGGIKKRVSRLLSRIDITTILFFLGILMAVACLEEVGVLSALGNTLNVTFDGNHYIVNGIIGVLSSIVDNVPLVAGCMGMYPIAPTGRLCGGRNFLAAACILRRSGRKHSHNRQRGRRSGHGTGENHFRMVHEACKLDSIRGISGRNSMLLAHKVVCILNKHKLARL